MFEIKGYFESCHLDQIEAVLCYFYAKLLFYFYDTAIRGTALYERFFFYAKRQPWDQSCLDRSF